MTDNPRSRFRELLDGPEIIVQPVVFDALTARTAEVVGHKAVGIGGNQLGAHLLGAPEPLLSLADLAFGTGYIANAVGVPVMVDAGAGFGEPLHAARTVRVIEHAGAASIHIEDQIFPKRAHYHKGVEHVIPVDDMVAKIRACVQARRDPDFLLVARTDAMRTDGYGEGIRRAQLYMEAGADMVMIFPNNTDEARSAPSDLSGIPVVYVNSEGNRLGRPVLGAAELQEFGYKVASFPLSLTNAAMIGVRSTLEELKANGELVVDGEAMTSIRQFWEDTIGMQEAWALEEATVEVAR